MKKFYACTLALMMICLAFTSNAQLTPQLSSTQTITQDLGLGKVTLTYSRPNTKGRKMLGGMEPYGTVWRTGANAATIIKFTDDVTIEGNKVPAGEYGLFTIPGADQWTVILTKTAKQWGAYPYKEADDFIRFTVKPTKMAEKMETFTMQFANVTTTSCDLHMLWDKVAVTLHITPYIAPK